MRGMQDERLILADRRKDEILMLLRKKGMRVTRQRRLILDTVFAHECTCCKEIYYQVAKKDKSIGIATVYRMINVLTELGVFCTGTPYRLSGPDTDCAGCRAVLADQSVVEFGEKELQEALEEALSRKGYSDEPKIERLILL